MQRHYAVLQALALEELDIPETNDETLPDEEGMSRLGLIPSYCPFPYTIASQPNERTKGEKSAGLTSVYLLYLDKSLLMLLT